MAAPRAPSDGNAANCWWLFGAAARLLRRREECEAEVLELPGVDRCRRVRQRIRTGLRLRERDHLADVLLAGEQRDETIHANRETCVRRRAVTERIEQEAEAFLRVFRSDPEQREDALLQLGPVNSHAPRAQLPTVE